MLHELNNVGRSYYFQPLKVNGQDLFLTSEWFRSDGIKYGLDKKPEILFTVGILIRSILNIIEGIAIKQLKVPQEILKAFNVQNLSNKDLYRFLHQANNLYGKLTYDCTCFNTRRKLVKKEDLGYGEYRVIVHVRGLFIGSHSQENKLASLQLRITQMQFREVDVPCLFEPSPSFNFQTGNSLPTQGQVTPITNKSSNPGTAPGASKKGRKKPVVQRQNAMVEGSPPPFMENIPAEFFDNLDI